MYALCADPKDKIFGMLGLANQEVLDSIRVNYSQNLYQLYVAVMNFYIREENVEESLTNQLVSMLSSLSRSVPLPGPLPTRTSIAAYQQYYSPVS
jgi:hypothetical protein